jgi:hypothetical protein
VTVDRELELTRRPVVGDRRMLFHAPIMTRLPGDVRLM